MRIRKIITGVCVLVASHAAAAQGAFDFDEIPGIDEAPIAAVDISPVMLGFIRAALAGVEPETAAMLQDLRSIRLRVYNASDNTREFSNFIDNLTEELEDGNWQQVMMVQDETANVRVHMQMTESEVSGMTVMLIDGSEAVFINIDGSISAENLGKVMAAMQAHGMMPPLAMPIPPAGGAPAPDRP